MYYILKYIDYITLDHIFYTLEYKNILNINSIL